MNDAVQHLHLLEQAAHVGAAVVRKLQQGAQVAHAQRVQLCVVGVGTQLAVQLEELWGCRQEDQMV